MIAEIFEGASPGVGIRIGPGDDAAVLEAGKGDLVVTTDLMIEEVHFRLDWIDARAAGARAAAAALSDLAAMGARPRGVFASIAHRDRAVVVAAGRGIREVADRFAAPLAGGDLSAAERLVIDVMAVGETEAPLLRTAARPGDDLWVTGALGAPAAALEAFLAGESPAEGLRARFAAPVPRIPEILALRDRLALHAAIDLSDGLLMDASRIAAASGVRLELASADLPVHPALAEAGIVGERALDFALRGGEEYEVLFTLPAGLLGADRVAAFTARFGLPLTRIGRVAEGEGVTLDGARLEPDGFDHFSGPAR